MSRVFCVAFTHRQSSLGDLHQRGRLVGVGGNAGDDLLLQLHVLVVVGILCNGAALGNVVLDGDESSAGGGGLTAATAKQRAHLAGLTD